MSNIKREELEHKIAENLGDDYACTRVWEAWEVGTMTQDDFVPLVETERVSELMQLIDQYTQGKVDEALGKPELETPEQILEKLKLSSWSMGLQGASEKELDNERQVQITVSQALVALDRYYKAQLADIKEQQRE